MNKSIVTTGGVIILLSIVLGAFGAHALKARLDTEQLASFETGVRYAMYHGLAFLIIGGLAREFKLSSWTFRILLFGVILFSGSIFFLALQPVLGVSMRFLGPVTPVGGLLLIIGWLLLIISLIRKTENSNK
jgi:uncharacterized membrane protein YgdD (TMEM256/DUF423 family)